MPESCSDLGAKGQLLVERDHVRNLQGELDASEARVEELEAGLRELVELKDGPRGAAYEQAKPLAWDRARALLKDGER